MFAITPSAITTGISNPKMAVNATSNPPADSVPLPETRDSTTSKQSKMMLTGLIKISKKLFIALMIKRLYIKYY
jgi:hypothetical protein